MRCGHFENTVFKEFYSRLNIVSPITVSICEQHRGIRCEQLRQTHYESIVKSAVYDDLSQLICENNHVLHCTGNCPGPSAQLNNIFLKHQKRRFYQAALFLCLKKRQPHSRGCLWLGERGMLFEDAINRYLIDSMMRSFVL